MQYKTLFKFLFVFLIFSACEVKWDMEISFEEDLIGKLLNSSIDRSRSTNVCG